MSRKFRPGKPSTGYHRVIKDATPEGADFQVLQVTNLTPQKAAEYGLFRGKKITACTRALADHFGGEQAATKALIALLAQDNAEEVSPQEYYALSEDVWLGLHNEDGWIAFLSSEY
jgi:hypothetical protein